jgi:DNA-binding LacI/PurR family transcriptional regulator
VQGRELKAECVRKGVLLYRVAAEAGMHPNRLSGLFNGKAPVEAPTATRIREAIERLAPTEAARV